MLLEKTLQFQEMNELTGIVFEIIYMFSIHDNKIDSTQSCLVDRYLTLSYFTKSQV